MMRMIASLLLLVATDVLAQDLPPPPPGSAHVLVLDYAEDRVIQVQGAPGYQVAIEFDGNERIENVAVGDSGAWQVTSNKRSDHLFVKQIQGGVSTNMVVVTDHRLYTFDLTPLMGPVDQMAYAIRFRYPSPIAPGPATEAMVGYYRLSGDRTLRPSAISDDGVHTYMEWPASAALPAIYALDSEGHETLANGAMREGIYVIDSVGARLIFRRDARVAYARRLVPKVRR